MSQNQFPIGWNDEKVRRVLAHYEEQSEDAAVENDASVEPSETVMAVRHNLVSKVRELIAKRHRR